MVFGAIILLFVIIGICGIQSAFAVNHTLPPRGYIGFSEYCDVGDTIDYEITSDVSVNIYIMNEGQTDLYLSGTELEPEYFGKSILSIKYIHGSYLVDWIDGIYMVLITNPSYVNEANLNVIIYTIPGEPEKSITVNSPTTNDIFDNGNNYIRWSTTGSINYVRIELWYGNSFSELIDDYKYNDGTYIWYLSTSDIYSEGSYYRIKISDYYDNSIYDFSDYFTIEIDEDYVDPYESAEPENYFLGWLVIILSAIAVVVVVAVLVRKHKRKIPEEDIKPGIIPIKTHCTECGTEILDKIGDFCSKCGAPLK